MRGLTSRTKDRGLCRGGVGGGVQEEEEFLSQWTRRAPRATNPPCYALERREAEDAMVYNVLPCAWLFTGVLKCIDKL